MTFVKLAVKALIFWLIALPIMNWSYEGSFPKAQAAIMTILAVLAWLLVDLFKHRIPSVILLALIDWLICAGLVTAYIYGIMWWWNYHNGSFGPGMLDDINANLIKDDIYLASIVFLGPTLGFITGVLTAIDFRILRAK